MFVAGVAHPVERHLAKVEVASSSLVARSSKKKGLLKMSLRIVASAFRHWLQKYA